MSTMEYHSTLKKEGNLDICINIMNLEDIMLSGINQIQKTNTAWPHLYVVLKNPNLEAESRLLTSRNGETLVKG